MTRSISTEDYAALLTEIGDGVPGAEQYQRMCDLVLDLPEARRLHRMDPFSPDYKAVAMGIYPEHPSV